MFNLALLLTLVQVLSEVLPISSSGHVHLLRVFLPLGADLPSATNDLLNGLSMLIMVLGTREAWALPLAHAVRGPAWQLRCVRLCRVVVRTGLLIALATCVTVPVYLGGAQLLARIPQQHLLLALGFSGTALLLWCSLHQQRVGPFCSLDWRLALLVGLVQGCAVLPGLSRMGAVYSVAVLCGMRGDRALQVAVALSVPLMTAATVRALSGQAAAWPFVWWQTLLVGIAFYGSYLLFQGVYCLAARGRLGMLWWYVSGVAGLAWLCWFFGL